MRRMSTAAKSPVRAACQCPPPARRQMCIRDSSKVAGLLSGMLSLRPIMGDDGHGSIAASEKVRGTQNAMRRLVELIAEGTRERCV